MISVHLVMFHLGFCFTDISRIEQLATTFLSRTPPKRLLKSKEEINFLGNQEFFFQFCNALNFVLKYIQFLFKWTELLPWNSNSVVVTMGWIKWVALLCCMSADPLCFHMLIVPAGKLVSLQGTLLALLSYNIPCSWPQLIFLVTACEQLYKYVRAGCPNQTSKISW